MDQMSRAGELKAELLEFSGTPQFGHDFQLLIEQYFPDGKVNDERRFSEIVDGFLHDQRLADGGTVIDCFVAARDDLSDQDREMLLSWRDSVRGVFELTEAAGDDGFLARNLIDELTYRIRSNKGAEGLRQLTPGMFLMSRVVPVGDYWLISGVPAVYAADAAAELSAMVAEYAVRNPKAVFRNPEKLAQARRLQAEQRDSFIELFGGDVTVVAGHELHETLMRFYRFNHEREGSPGGEWTAPPMTLPREWTEADSVAMIYDLEDGLGFYVDYAAAQEVFDDPGLVVRGRYRDVVSGFLRDEDLSPVPIRRLAAQDAGKADQVFRKLLGKPGFSWARDGEALLRRYKLAYFADPPLPRILAASDEMAARLRAAG
jgi:hypothetical protein